MKGDVFLCCFGLGKKDSDSSELPQIVITFHEENPGGNNNTRDSILEPGVDFGASRSLYTPSIGQIKPKPVANNDDLSKAHEEVINQMRKALKEARGGDLQNKNQDNQNNTLIKGDLIATDKATAQTGQQPSSKPPVPPTKALAVAKIRAAIAQAKQDGGGGTIQLPPPPAESENCDTLNSKTRNSG